jgi:hypothetical protein
LLNRLEPLLQLHLFEDRRAAASQALTELRAGMADLTRQLDKLEVGFARELDELQATVTRKLDALESKARTAL